MNGNNALFKFCSAASGAAILRHNSVFVTSPLDLNDPFEMRPAWTTEHEERHRQDRELRNNLIDGLPMFIAMKGDNLTYSGPTPRPKSHPPMEVTRQRGIADLHNERVFRELHAGYRVLSFATGVLDLAHDDFDAAEEATLMWAHYADQFQGVCLAVDPNQFSNGIQGGGFVVNYEKTRRSLPPSFYDVHLKVGGSDYRHGSIFSTDADTGLQLPPETHAEKLRRHYVGLLTHKSPAWSYEREVRMIYDIESLRTEAVYRPLRSPCNPCKADGKELKDCISPLYRDAIHLPAEAVRAVIVGADCGLAEAKQIISILADSRYAHVALYWSSLPSDCYTVNYSKSDLDYVAFIQEMRTGQIADAKGHVRYDDEGKTVFPTKKGENFAQR